MTTNIGWFRAVSEQYQQQQSNHDLRWNVITETSFLLASTLLLHFFSFLFLCDLQCYAQMWHSHAHTELIIGVFSLTLTFSVHFYVSEWSKLRNWYRIELDDQSNKTKGRISIEMYFNGPEIRRKYWKLSESAVFNTFDAFQCDGILSTSFDEANFFMLFFAPVSLLTKTGFLSHDCPMKVKTPACQPILLLIIM